MKVLLFCGSARADANSRRVVRYVNSLLQQEGIETAIFDVGEQRLPLFDGEKKTLAHPVVTFLQEQAQRADGFFVCTPEYHSGMSGSLKNAFDFLNWDHFSKKPVSIVATAGGGKGGINALNNLRLVLRGVGALVLTQQVVVDPQDILDDDELASATQERLKQLVQELKSFLS
jgi:azobenzene reductase